MNAYLRPEQRAHQTLIGKIQKLIEYRTAHYSAHSEASSYYTNHPAQVQFRFANPIVCRLTRGLKIMSVGGGHPFTFRPGDVMYVPPGMEIDIDLGAATTDNPIECDCFEIESGRMEKIVARLNENMSARGNDLSATIDWTQYTVIKSKDADSLDLVALMDLFRAPRTPFSEMRIEARIDEMLMTLMQLCSGELLQFQSDGASDTGLMAASRMIRENLDRHFLNEELAKTACMSASTLHRQFRRHFGTSPRQFANRLRIAQAKRDLRKCDECIEALAIRLGFSSAGHFSREFRKITGETPAAYRRRRMPQPGLSNWQ